MKKKVNAERAIRMIAMQEGKTVEYVRSEMILAMNTGLNNPDPKIQEYWKQIPCKGDVPTPEELITYLTTHIRTGKNPFN